MTSCYVYGLDHMTSRFVYGFNHMTDCCVYSFDHMTSCYDVSLLQDGHTALMLAAVDGNTKIVQLLLEQYKAGVDEKDLVSLMCVNPPPPPKYFRSASIMFGVW